MKIVQNNKAYLHFFFDFLEGTGVHFEMVDFMFCEKEIEIKYL